MHNLDLLPQLLSKINENQLALEAAIMELSNWVALNGSAVRRPGYTRSEWRVHQNGLGGNKLSRLTARCSSASPHRFPSASITVYPNSKA